MSSYAQHDTEPPADVNHHTHAAPPSARVFPRTHARTREYVTGYAHSRTPHGASYIVVRLRVCIFARTTRRGKYDVRFERCRIAILHVCVCVCSPGNDVENLKECVDAAVRARALEQNVGMR